MKTHRITRTKRDRINAAIVTGLLAALAWTALAHGAVEPWSVMLFELIVLALIVLWTIKIVGSKRFQLTIPQIALPIVALIGIGLLQSFAVSGADAERRSLSLDIESTRRTVIVLIFLLISFLIAGNFLSTRKRLAVLAGFLSTFGLLLAIFAFVQHFAWNGKLYWFRPITVSTSPFGPFVNHNHFAGYMELLIPVPIALIITRAVRSETRLLYGFAAALMGIALVASLSRGGMIGLAASLIFLMLMSSRLAENVKEHRRRHYWSRYTVRGLACVLQRFERVGAPTSRTLIVLSIAGAITAGLVWVGPDPVAKRITQSQVVSHGQQDDFSNRAWVWRDTLSMIRANPVFGVGLGAYGTAFPIYSRSDGSIKVLQAHNDYLQVVADSGAIGGLIALWFLALIFRAVRRSIKSHDPLMAGLALGSGGGIFAILVHSLFDFNLQLPGTALLFLVLLAVLSNVNATVRVSEGAQTLTRVPRADLEQKNMVVTTQVEGGMSS